MKSRELEIFQQVAKGQITRDEAKVLLQQLYGTQATSAPPEDRHYRTGDSSGKDGYEGEDGIRSRLIAIVSNVLHIPAEELGSEASFKDLGVDSISGVEIVRDLNKAFGLNLDAVVLYDYPTIPGLTEHIMREREKAQQALVHVSPDDGEPVGEGSSVPDRYRDPNFAKFREKFIQEEYTASQPDGKDLPGDRGGKITLKQNAISKQNTSPKQNTASNQNITTPKNDTGENAPPVFESNFDDEGSVRKKLMAIVGNVLHIPAEELGSEASFKELGVDSISGVEIVRDINKAFGLNLDAVVLYDYPTIPGLTEHIMREREKAQQALVHVSPDNGEPVGEGSSVPDRYRDPSFAKFREKFIQEEYTAFQPVGKDSSWDRGTKITLKQNAIAKHNTAPKQETTPPVDVSGNNSLPVYESHFNGEEGSVRRKLRGIVGNVLHIPEEELGSEASFKELGVDSISGVEIVRDINKAFGLNLDAVVLYDYATIPSLAQHILQEREKMGQVLSGVSEDGGEAPARGHAIRDIYTDPNFAKFREKFIQDEHTPVDPAEKGWHGADRGRKLVLKPNKTSEAGEKEAPLKTLSQPGEAPQPPQADNLPVNINVKASKGFSDIEQQDIAIIGISGRFPGANNVYEFWENLKNGVDSITEVPPERWDVRDYYETGFQGAKNSYSQWMGMLSDADKFDPLFFNISPLEAELMDPQQRIFLEEAWKAFEDAGYSQKALSGVNCGVFVGATVGNYERQESSLERNSSGETFTGMSPSILPARISYFLNLTGASISLDTACSSSLVAIHLACRSILNNESQIALAGGVRLMLTPELQIQTNKLGILSPTGKCKTFDQDADGIVMGEAAAAIILKPLSKAIQDRDYIYGVIKGSGINQDGKTNGITAPSALSQTKLELDVYKRAGISPKDITLVEAHGTGTQLGDPIEVKALTDAFRQYLPEKQYCAIGSVKTNIGHTTMAAGVSSVIKVLLALKHKQIPPSLHFQKANENINFQASPFYVNTELKDWQAEKGKPRLAAISSFGFSGTNCHMLIQEGPGC